MYEAEMMPVATRIVREAVGEMGFVFQQEFVEAGTGRERKS
jgi:hypothetical protein